MINKSIPKDFALIGVKKIGEIVGNMQKLECQLRNYCFAKGNLQVVILVDLHGVPVIN